jgi:hypothetical protein
MCFLRNNMCFRRTFASAGALVSGLQLGLRSDLLIDR